MTPPYLLAVVADRLPKRVAVVGVTVRCAHNSIPVLLFFPGQFPVWNQFMIFLRQPETDADLLH